MNFINFFVFSLVLFNVISPLVSASINIPSKEVRILGEQLSDLFGDTLEEEKDPTIDELSVVNVEPPTVTIAIDEPLEEEEVCHPKDLSCNAGKVVTVVDTLTGEHVEEILVGDGSFEDISVGSKDELVVVDDVVVERESRNIKTNPKAEEKGEKPIKKSTIDDKSKDMQKPMIEMTNQPMIEMATKSIMEEAKKPNMEEAKKPMEEDQKEIKDAHKPSLISLLKGETKESLEDKIKTHIHDKVVHFNKKEEQINDEVLVPIKERRDTIVEDIKESIDQIKPKMKTESKGMFDSFFTIFG